MMIIRYVQPEDRDGIYHLAEKAGYGMTSLKPDMDMLMARIQRSCHTVDGCLDKAEQGYLFVLEDVALQKVVGVCGIDVAVGLNEPWYNFHVGTQVHSSKNLNVYRAFPTLFLSNDNTNCSELCSLFLDPEYRKDANGKFLSKIRFLFIAAFRQYFEKTLIAEMRGYSDENGRSPFWDAVGHKFFNIDFAHADYLSGLGQKVFIAELMPRYPIYVDMLPIKAQQVIGKVHPKTLPAYRLLESEGLCYQGYVDIFDAGATLQADIENLRAIKDSQLVTVNICSDRLSAQEQSPYLVSNDQYAHYRAIISYHKPECGILTITPEQAEQLNVQQDDQVRVLTLNIKGK
ncbi:arginine N-succinyltransferase [Acinetobacter qingfengensis]|uniref:Arginine N-succinyltransferase n=1 Tax=Acinetobacter qingfengensis TaxID=1262585 RepID=A0A1E7RB25_9GAMM|nr:arginine N-succinyltransferase [Acinetobacter qingfengensis]KAA8734789.1 arginine N-succinyltransferase [Acinetobacter qingfengensis]OEY96417.1 arginine N-succinyltransferase [Acinetobacter qingfengensis]